jgi:hypothetical protein
MNTKRDYAFQLMDLLYPTPTSDAKLEMDIAMLAISQAADQVRIEEIYRLKSLGSNIIPSNYLSTFDKNIFPKYDEGRCEWYIDLPAKVLALPNNQGLQQVAFKKHREQVIRVVSPMYLSAFKNSLTKDLDGDYACYIDGWRIYFINDLDEETELLVRMLASANDIGEFDYFPIDGGIESRMLEKAASLYGVQKKIPQDLTNNNESE